MEKKKSQLGVALIDGLKQAVAHEMKMTPQAKRLWEEVPNWAKPKILNNVWCSGCSGVCSIGNVRMTVENGDLILKGICTKCSHSVCRVVEQD